MHPASGSLATWLSNVRAIGGSDLLLVSGLVPTIRAHGALHATEGEVLDSDRILAATRPLVPPRLAQQFDAGEAIDLAFSMEGLGRFRMNLHRERGRVAASIRALPMAVPRFDSLGFSHDISLLSELPRGLVLVAGPTGSGKTTTVAALVAEIGARDDRHIITIEDPVEYEHGHGRSVVEQIEIGVDAESFPVALRSALRQAPDVLVVGEMRDTESIRIAVTAAETGHLVIATVHAPDVGGAVSRIADVFPAERQNTVRQELAMGLAAVLTQSLLRGTDGTLVPASELLVVSYGARQHIRRNQLQNLHQEMTSTRKLGSFNLEESLASLVRAGRIDRATAYLRAAHHEELELLLGDAPIRRV